MARRLMPPQHRVDTKIEYVPETDDAWDLERIEREQAGMVERKEDPDEHPVIRYARGLTRFDLDAEDTVDGETVRPRDYLDMGKKPEIWKIRRIQVQDWYEIKDEVEVANRAGRKPYRAYIKACQVGIEGVENLDLKLEVNKRGRMSLRDMEILRSFGDETIEILGLAVYHANRELTVEEKKVSGS